jgi:type IV pilus assembly protein PilM
MDVLFVGVPVPMVDRIMRITGNAGLATEIMDIDNLALVNSFLAFEPEPVNESVVLINIGHVCSNLVVLENQQLRFIRNVTFGGRDVSSEIAQRLGVTEDMAEEIKKRPEFWKETGLNIRNVLRKSMPDLIEAIYRSIEFCMSRKKIVNVDRILITGGSAQLQGMDRFITEALGIDTERWNPLDGIAVPEGTRKEQGYMLSIALGLAIRHGKHA